MVMYDQVTDPKVVYYRLEERYSICLIDGGDNGFLGPLGETCRWRRTRSSSHHRPQGKGREYPPPYNIGPGGRNHVQHLSWSVDLLGVELSCLTSPYQLGCILESCRTIAIMLKGLTDQRVG
jgi:hypothetical protein